VITLKHLARTLNVDPYTLRMALRAAGLQPQVNRRWKWESEEDSQYRSALNVGRAYVSKSSGLSSSSSAESTPEGDGAGSYGQG